MYSVSIVFLQWASVSYDLSAQSLQKWPEQVNRKESGPETSLQFREAQPVETPHLDVF